MDEVALQQELRTLEAECARRGANGEPVGAHVEAAVVGLTRRHFAAAADERERVRTVLRAFSEVRSALMGLADRCVRDIRARADATALRDGVGAVVVEDFNIDPRESITALQDLWLAAADAGLDPVAEFRRQASLAGPRAAEFLTCFAAEPDLEEARARASYRTSRG